MTQDLTVTFGHNINEEQQNKSYVTDIICTKAKNYKMLSTSFLSYFQRNFCGRKHNLQLNKSRILAHDKYIQKNSTYDDKKNGTHQPQKEIKT